MTVADHSAPRRGFALRPEGLLVGPAARQALAAGVAQPLAGTALAFMALEIVAPAGRVVLPLDGARGWAAEAGLGADLEAGLARLSAPRPPFAGLSLDRPRLMGVVNVTPDSFSDGGRYIDPGRAVDHGLALQAAGADILDIGGESTRPGAAPVPIEEELRRILPVLRGLKAGGAVVSVDTRRAAVMRAALEAGADMVNDITALAGEPGSLATVAAGPAAVVLMHMQGEPRSMQANPVYADAPLDIRDYFVGRLEACAAAGIAQSRIAVDPGIGFGKTDAHNIQLLQSLGLFHELGVALLLGVSRKSFIGRLSRGEEAGQRLAGSLAAGLAGLDRGAQILRVHDVTEARQALAIWQAIAGERA
jgi:dihydropteroate synthase